MTANARKNQPNRSLINLYSAANGSLNNLRREDRRWLRKPNLYTTCPVIEWQINETLKVISI